MKILIVYYSRTETTKKIAEKLQTLLKSDIQEIIDLKNRAGVVVFVTGSMDALFGKTTQIKPEKIAVNKYDLVVVGTPVWAGTMVPAIRTVLTNNKFKNVAFFCTCSGSVSKTFTEMEKVTGSKPKATLVLITKDVAKGKIESDLKQFVKNLTK